MSIPQDDPDRSPNLANRLRNLPLTPQLRRALLRREQRQQLQVHPALNAAFLTALLPPNRFGDDGWFSCLYLLSYYSRLPLHIQRFEDFEARPWRLPPLDVFLSGQEFLAARQSFNALINLETLTVVYSPALIPFINAAELSICVNTMGPLWTQLRLARLGITQASQDQVTHVVIFSVNQNRVTLLDPLTGRSYITSTVMVIGELRDLTPWVVTKLALDLEF